MRVRMWQLIARGCRNRDFLSFVFFSESVLAAVFPQTAEKAASGCSHGALPHGCVDVVPIAGPCPCGRSLG